MTVWIPAYGYSIITKQRKTFEPQNGADTLKADEYALTYQSKEISFLKRRSE